MSKDENLIDRTPFGLRNPYRNLKSWELKVMPRNLNEIVRSWIRLQEEFLIIDVSAVEW